MPDNQTTNSAVITSTPPWGSNCPSDAEIARMQLVRLSDAEVEQIVRHASECEHCRRRFKAASQAFAELCDAMDVTPVEMGAARGHRIPSGEKHEIGPTSHAPWFWVAAAFGFGVIVIAICSFVWLPRSRGTALAIADTRGEFRLDSHGKLAGAGAVGVSIEWRIAVESLLGGHGVPHADSLAGPLSQIRTASIHMGADGSAEEVVLVSPEAGTQLASPTQFECQPVAGATAYDFVISPANEAPTLLRVNTPRTPLPEGVRLAPRQVHEWRVRVHIPDRELYSAPRRFVILDRADAELLQANERQFQGSPLLLGVLYAAYGLEAQAERQFAAVRAANPGNPLSTNVFLAPNRLRNLPMIPR